MWMASFTQSPLELYLDPVIQHKCHRNALLITEVMSHSALKHSATASPARLGGLQNYPRRCQTLSRSHPMQVSRQCSDLNVTEVIYETLFQFQNILPLPVTHVLHCSCELVQSYPCFVSLNAHSSFASVKAKARDHVTDSSYAIKYSATAKNKTNIQKLRNYPKKEY